MQQCDFPYVVKYYGSYFKNTDLWIVMEYCGAGSVLDIMKLRGIYHVLNKGELKYLTEDEIATVLSDTLKGLEYLHLGKKIHRDIKAGNILLNSEGQAKLADFGVAGQLSDSIDKRKTVIGTPFWMAPEVIQGIGYHCVADIWSLGITALEMAEGKAPYCDIHPIRAIFMIPTKPPPSFNDPDKWSSQFIDFVSRCLVKNPEDRTTASELLSHEFIRNAKPSESLREMIAEAQETKEELQSRKLSSSDNCGTMMSNGYGTLIDNTGGTSYAGTMIKNTTLVPNHRTSDLESIMGTMVINDDNEEDDDTMKRHNTAPGEQRPAFLDHFDSTPQTCHASEKANQNGPSTLSTSSSEPAPQVTPKNTKDAAGFQRHFQQIAGGQSSLQALAQAASFDNAAKFQRCIAEGDLEFLKYLSVDEMTSKVANLDQEMERDIDDLRRRYHAKRQPILDAMDQKRKRQQNF